MKYFKSLICIFLVAVLLSGCTFRLASSVNDLISAVSPFGDNANIKEAMDDFIQSGYYLKNPTSGKYITSYNFYDIDNDGNNEAIAFYETYDNAGIVNMALLNQSDTKWNVVASTVGLGSSIYCLDFSDINNDGYTDILVCWNNISNSTNHTFLAYSINISESNTTFEYIGDEQVINNYAVVDYDNNNKNELLLFEITSGSKNTSKALLYSLDDNDYDLIGETKLDSRVISYVSIKQEIVDNDLRIYADALCSDGESELTELIYYSDTYGTIISPFYSYSTGITSGTSRDCLINSFDINDDGYIEIPNDVSVDNLPSNVSAIDWKVYKNTVLIHKCYSLYVKSDNYTVIIDNDMINNIKVDYLEDTKELIISNSNNELEYSVMPVLKAVYDESNYQGYSILFENSGYYYLAKIGNSDISVEQLKNYVKTC